MFVGDKVAIEDGRHNWRVVQIAPNYVKLRRGDSVREYYRWQIQDVGTKAIYQRWSETPSPYGGDRIYFLYPKGTEFVELRS